MKPPKLNFQNLDGLRSVAFFLVFIQHAFWNPLSLIGISPESRLLSGVLNGGVGVSAFFVLSGFLITYLILDEIEVFGQVHVPYFYMRRLLRIWPLYFAVVIFALVLYPYLKDLLGIVSDVANRPLYYFLFLSNFDVIYVEKFFAGKDMLAANITWSVAVEEQFYLVWPLIFFALPKKLYKWVFPVIILVSLIFRAYHAGDRQTIYFHSLSVCGDLAMGGLAAYYCVNGRSLKRWMLLFCTQAIVLVYIFGFAWLMFAKDFAGPIYRLVNTAFFAFVILEQNYASESFYKFSKSRLLTFWGKYTYGLYLLHPIAILILDIAMRTVHFDYKSGFATYFAFGLGALGVSLALSYVSYQYYEKFFLRWKDRFSFIDTNRDNDSGQEDQKGEPLNETAINQKKIRLFIR